MLKLYFFFIFKTSNENVAIVQKCFFSGYAFFLNACYKSSLCRVFFFHSFLMYYLQRHCNSSIVWMNTKLVQISHIWSLGK